MFPNRRTGNLSNESLSTFRVHAMLLVEGVRANAYFDLFGALGNVRVRQIIENEALARCERQLIFASALNQEHRKYFLAWLAIIDSRRPKAVYEQKIGAGGTKVPRFREHQIHRVQHGRDGVIR